jgi:hypothetical protein
MRLQHHDLRLEPHLRRHRGHGRSGKRRERRNGRLRMPDARGSCLWSRWEDVWQLVRSELRWCRGRLPRLLSGRWRGWRTATQILRYRRRLCLPGHGVLWWELCGKDGSCLSTRYRLQYSLRGACVRVREPPMQHGPSRRWIGESSAARGGSVPAYGGAVVARSEKWNKCWFDLPHGLHPGSSAGLSGPGALALVR